MIRLRRRVAVLAAVAVSAAILVSAPGAAAQTAPAPSQEASVHQPAIDALARVGAESGIDLFAGTGCADSDELCPQEPLSRWEMAVWLVRIIDRADPPAVSSSSYADVDAGAWWAAHVERLVELGIVIACSTEPLRFCADAPINRGLMAAVLTLAFDLPPAERAWFVDVNSEHRFAEAIDRLAGWGATVGCGAEPARYCPDQRVTRAQMATFLARTLRRVSLHPLLEPTYEPAQDPAALPIDPAVTVGTLDNGLTYYLRHNDRPGENLAVRLLINVGSVDETDAEAGIGHFVEHMLFNGTTDYPGNSLDEALREIGVELGPDSNAFVGHDQTGYLIDVHLDADHKAPLVFHALSQMAAEATLDAEAIEAERGVILDERRLRVETVDGFIAGEFDRVYTQGTPYEGRDPIGTLENIQSFTPEEIRAFYEKWYVPANMAIVAVGDLPVEDLQALVNQYFGPLTPGEGRQPPSQDIPPNPESSSHVITDPREGLTYISLDIPIDPHDLGTVGGDRLSTMESLIELMVHNRLNDAYQRGELSQVDPPRFFSFSYTRGLRYYGTNWKGDDLDSASTDYLSVLLTAQEHGFTAGDLQRAASQIAASLQLQLANVASTKDDQWASRYHSHFLFGADIDTVENSVVRTLALMSKLTPEELTEHFRWQMQRGGLLAIAVGPDPASVPTEADLDAAWAAAAPGPPPEEAAEIEQLMDLPEPVDPVSEGSFNLIDGGYEWEFANGARVMFAPSDIARGIVHLRAESLGGWSVLEPGERALSAIAVDAVQGSGLGDLSRIELNRFLEDRNVSLGAFIGETVEGLSGGASVDDVETLFQLVHLLVTAPRVDEQAFADAINTADTRLELSQRDPRWQAAIAYLEARYGDTWHRAVASREEIDSLTPERLLATFQRRLGSVDDLVVAVVGEIDAATVESLARHYIGTLPGGGDDTYINRQRPLPDGLVERRVTVGEGESAWLEIYHEAAIEVTPLGAVAADVLETALSDRLFLVIREELGASYSAGASVDVSVVPSHLFDSRVVVTIDPARYDEIRGRVLEIVADVAANGLTDEEFAQARAIEAADYANLTNAHLLRALLSRRAASDADVVTQARRALELARLTPADVHALAAALYGEGGRIEVSRRP